MSKQIELESLDRTIKDSQIRIHTFKNNIDLLDKEIATLKELEAQLEENINCLKQNKITVIATEFRKAKEDLKKTKHRLIAASNDREDHKKGLESLHKLIKDSEEAIEKIKKSGENNVVRGNFGKKDNG